MLLNFWRHTKQLSEAHRLRITALEYNLTTNNQS